MSEPLQLATEEQRRQFIELMPYAQKLGIEIESGNSEEVVGRMRWQLFPDVARLGARHHRP